MRAPTFFPSVQCSTKWRPGQCRSGATLSAAIFDAILNRDPAPALRLNPELPTKLDDIIQKALEKDPGLRYQHASEIRTDLQRLQRGSETGREVRSSDIGRGAGSSATGTNLARRLGVLAVVLLLVAAVGGYFWRSRRHVGAAGVNTASIAVLPFADMSPGKDQEYFSDGLAEELTNELAKVPGLKVTGRSSAFQFKGKNEDLRTVGQKLNVANVLEGSVRREGNHVRITAELTKVRMAFSFGRKNTTPSSKTSSRCRMKSRVLSLRHCKSSCSAPTQPPPLRGRRSSTPTPTRLICKLRIS